MAHQDEGLACVAAVISKTDIGSISCISPASFEGNTEVFQELTTSLHNQAPRAATLPPRPFPLHLPVATWAIVDCMCDRAQASCVARRLIWEEKVGLCFLARSTQRR
jgi:hypothetical protein